jgi:PhnB protein
MSNFEPRETYAGVTAYVTVTNAREAGAFYERALGATIADQRTTEDGRLMHCEARINGGPFMFNDPFPEHGMVAGAGGCTMTLIVVDAKAWWDRAIAAGMESVVELHDAFWGDKYGMMKDPYGVNWAVVGPQPSAA